MPLSLSAPPFFWGGRICARCWFPRSGEGASPFQEREEWAPFANSPSRSRSAWKNRRRLARLAPAGKPRSLPSPLPHTRTHTHPSARFFLALPSERSGCGIGTPARLSSEEEEEEAPSWLRGDGPRGAQQRPCAIQGKPGRLDRAQKPGRLGSSALQKSLLSLSLCVSPPNLFFPIQSKSPLLPETTETLGSRPRVRKPRNAAASPPLFPELFYI